MTTNRHNSPVKLPIVAIYGLDLDVRNTSSLGIINLTRRLIEAMSHCPPPGYKVVLLVNEKSVKDLVPLVLPSWITAYVVQCHCSGILSRLWADQVLAGYYAGKIRAAVVHFPKGFVPVWGIRGARIVTTIHDTIVFYYARNYPRWFPVIKIKYFCWMTLCALRSAARVLTDSTFSRDELVRLYPSAASKTEVVLFGAGVVERVFGQLTERHGLMVLGSLFPHKATYQTLRLLNDYAVHKGLTAMEVVITGLPQWPEAWGQTPDRLALSFRGRVSDIEMAKLYGESLALVLLSEIEGLGLPAIESYAAGTPVCYRASTSLAEVLAGVPGGWDGSNKESFFKALEEALSLPREEISRIRQSLSEKFDWERAAKRVLAVYAEELRAAGADYA